MRFPAPDDSAEGDIGDYLLHFCGWFGDGLEQAVRVSGGCVFCLYFSLCQVILISLIIILKNSPSSFSSPSSWGCQWGHRPALRRKRTTPALTFHRAVLSLHLQLINSIQRHRSQTDLHSSLFVRSGPPLRGLFEIGFKTILWKEDGGETLTTVKAQDTEDLVPTWVLSPTNLGFEQNSRSLEIQI